MEEVDLFKKGAFQELKNNFQILEKQQATETWECCSDHLFNMTRPENIRRNRIFNF